MECRIFVEHVKRRSNKMAILVDNLSRESSTTTDDLEKIQGLQWHTPQGALNKWLANQGLDWRLPEKLVADVKKLLH